MPTDNRGGGAMLFYATRDGQARRIAEHISHRLAERGIAATPQELMVSPVSAAVLGQGSAIILIAAVRYGRHSAGSRVFPRVLRIAAIAAAAGAGLGQSHCAQAGEDDRRRQYLSAQIHCPPSPDAGCGRGFRRPARLSALRLARSPNYPLHHAADQGPDRPRHLRGIHVMAGGRRLRRAHCRPAAV